MQYAYLLFASLFLVPWLILFVVRKDTRKEMIWAGIIVAIFGLIAERYWYTQDWVNPITVTGTIIGLEDLIMGFAAGGITAVIYKEIFRENDYKCDRSSLNTRWIIIIGLGLGLIVADILFRFFGVFSFYANLIGFGLIATIALTMRPDLIKEGIMGGVLLVAVSMPIYWATFYIFPFWRDSYWQTWQISNILFAGIPYEDLIWWFFAGVNIAIAYDYYYGRCVRKLPES